MKVLTEPAQPMVEPDFYSEDIGFGSWWSSSQPEFWFEIIDSEAECCSQIDNGNIKKLNVEFARLEKIWYNKDTCRCGVNLWV